MARSIAPPTNYARQINLKLDAIVDALDTLASNINALTVQQRDLAKAIRSAVRSTGQPLDALDSMTSATLQNAPAAADARPERGEPKRVEAIGLPLGSQPEGSELKVLHEVSLSIPLKENESGLVAPADRRHLPAQVGGWSARDAAGQPYRRRSDEHSLPQPLTQDVVSGSAETAGCDAPSLQVIDNSAMGTFHNTWYAPNPGDPAALHNDPTPAEPEPRQLERLDQVAGADASTSTPRAGEAGRARVGGGPAVGDPPLLSPRARSFAPAGAEQNIGQPKRVFDAAEGSLSGRVFNESNRMEGFLKVKSEEEEIEAAGMARLAAGLETNENSRLRGFVKVVSEVGVSGEDNKNSGLQAELKVPSEVGAEGGVPEIDNNNTPRVRGLLEELRAEAMAVEAEAGAREAERRLARSRLFGGAEDGTGEEIRGVGAEGVAPGVEVRLDRADEGLTAAERERRMGVFQRTGLWLPDWGPAPTGSGEPTRPRW